MENSNKYKFFGQVGQPFEMTAPVRLIRRWYVTDGPWRKSKILRIEYTYEWVVGEYLFRWFTTNNSFEEGLYRISGVIKEHRGWYKNLNQTLVWKCKLKKLFTDDDDLNSEDVFEGLLKSGLYTGNDWD